VETRLEIPIASLANRKPSLFQLDGEPICVAKIDGEIFAVGDICSHQNVSLSEGEVVGYDIECWLHGSRFDLRTGEPDSPPAVVAVPTYAVTVAEDLAIIERKK